MTTPSSRNGSVALVLGAALLLSACGAASRDKLLRTFFDGVPPAAESPTGPPAEPAQEGGPSVAPVARESRTLHEPYRDGDCSACHDPKRGHRVPADRKLCFRCHEEDEFRGAVLHDPVSEGECTVCHDPHESPWPALARHPMPGLCHECHDPDRLERASVHRSGKGNDCLACHEPHRSRKPRLLR